LSRLIVRGHYRRAFCWFDLNVGVRLETESWRFSL
jgi:hypothetical protein